LSAREGDRSGRGGGSAGSGGSGGAGGSADSAGSGGSGGARRSAGSGHSARGRAGSARRAAPLPALVAPDSFKGTFSAREVAAAIADGLRSADREARELPVADGGEGTMEVLVTALGGEVRTVTASDPLGRPIEAGFALLADGSAVVETAQGSGLGLVDEGERDAWGATTRGTGELIVAAVEAGAEKVIVTVGGSATTDGGAGALEALDEAGVEVSMDVLCDVRVPFEDAPRIFAPQKGADAAMVKRLERRLDEQAERLPRDPRGEPMTGAAGGLSGGLWAARGARLVPGAPYVLDAIGFDDLMRASAFVVTGEGSLDEQTLQGKIVGEVATRCRQGGVTCHAIVGRGRLDPFSERILDLASVTEASTLADIKAAGRALV
jgi:glycerate kinase